jgi:putative DNA primase/helicase
MTNDTTKDIPAQVLDDLTKPRIKILQDTTQPPFEETSYDNYIVRPDGLYHVTLSKEGEEPKEQRICSPIWPIAHLRDIDNKGHALLVKVHDGEQEHVIAIPRKLLGRQQEINETLLDLGQDIPLNPSIQKLLIQFLMKAKPKHKKRSVDKAGWHGDQYVFADGTVIGSAKDAESVYPVNETSPKGIRVRGTLEEWQNNVFNLCVGNSRLIFSVGVALAAICQKLAGEDSGGFNFKGRSSIGKTKCLNVAVSIYGSPEFKRSWKTTSNGLEGVCALHNDCLLPLDEFGQADAGEAGEISYMISQGIGKQRASRDGSPKDPKVWRVMMLSTGEVGLEEHMRTGKKKPMAGQQARIADIPAEIANGYGCFNYLHHSKDGAEFSDEIDRQCREYYGIAGRVFIEKLISDGIGKAKTHLNFIIDDFVADNSQGYDGQVKRVARRFGLVYAALSLAIKLGILGVDLSEEQAKDAVIQCYKDWLNDRGTTGDLESHNLIDQVTGILKENSEGNFANYDKSIDDRTLIVKWGYRLGSKFYVYPKAFREYLCKGFNQKSAAKILMQDGLLQGSNDGKSSRSERIPANGMKKERYYIIDLDAVEEA